MGAHVADRHARTPRELVDRQVRVGCGIAWQGGGLVVDRLVPAGGGAWRTTRAIPLGGDWKVTLRLQRGRNVLGAPVRLPADRAIPVEGIPAAPHSDRAFVADRSLLQRERKQDVPGWLWGTASLVVLLLALGFIASLAWGRGRVARAGLSGGASRTLDLRVSVAAGARSRP